MLPAWLGSDAALEKAIERGETQALREMIEGWPFFASNMNMLEMVLAKVDLPTVAEYEGLLVAPDLRYLGESLRAREQRLVERLLGLLQQTELLERVPLTQQAISVRNPYIIPLHQLQSELLARVRAAEQQSISNANSDRLEAALMVTMAGIAAGLRNTG